LAKAEIHGKKVIVSAPEVPHPHWLEQSCPINFINKEGLLAIPSKSDNPWDKLF
jgi:sialate O-acetylesterase